MDLAVVRGHAENVNHGPFGFLNFAFPIVVFRGLWQEEDADAQNNGPEEANAHGNPPRSGVLDPLGPVIDDIGNQDAYRNHELITTGCHISPNPDTV